MMRPAKRNLFICLALCAVAVGIGFVQAGYLKSQCNLKFEPSEERYLEMAVATLADIYAIGDEDGKLYEGYDFAVSADDLGSRSDCVLRVRVCPELKLMGECILASVDIVKTLSGSAPESERIYIYEPIFISEVPAYFSEYPDLKGPLTIDGAANRLRPGDEYIVALKRAEIGDGAFSPEHEGRVYIYTDMLCSAFPCGKEPVYYQYASDEWNQDDPLRYKDIYDADYVCSKHIIGSCKRLYGQMLDYFGQENFN